ncbi:MAG: ribonuclease P protein component [Algicola sp.]|nr:ribonuclease P protein component [Algicola sp.]
MKNRFNKTEKLKSKTLIASLFSEGQSVSAYPLRLVYLKIPLSERPQLKVGVSVPKRHFKKAVDRNHIKRLLREGYRLNKVAYFNNIETSYAFMILYIGKKGTTFDEIHTKTQRLFEAFLKKTAP